MEKTHITVPSIDCIDMEEILTSRQMVVKDADGHHVYVNEENLIAKGKNYVSNITIYEKTGNGAARVIQLNPTTIKKLHELIVEIESKHCTIDLTDY